jgi:ethanolamine permease
MMPVESIIFGRVIYAVAPVLPEFVFSVIVALVFTAVNIIGIRISAIVQLVLTVILFGGIITFVVLGVPHVSMENFSPYFAEGIGGMLLMVPIAMLGFMGFDILPQASEETKEPPYKLVYLIPLSITFVCVVYVSILTIAAGVVNYKVIAQSTDPVPLIAVVSSYMGETGALIILLAGICGLTTTLNAFVVGSSRLLMALGRDRNLPEFLSRVHPRFGTPHWAILVIGLFGVVGSFYGKLITLLDMASTVVIIAYILVCLSLISLRKKEPELQRPYKVPLYPVVPIIAIIGSLIALVVEATLVATIDWIVLVGLVVLGVLYYFASVRKAET